MTKIKTYPVRCMACLEEYVLGQALIMYKYTGYVGGGDIPVEYSGVVHKRQDCLDKLQKVADKAGWPDVD